MEEKELALKKIKMSEKNKRKIKEENIEIQKT